MKVLNTAAGMNFGLVGKNIRRYLTTTALTATGVIALASPALADNWTDLETISGSFDTDISIPDQTNIQQHSDIVRARGDLDIGKTHTVNITGGSLFAAWDVETDPTYILGRLNSTGKVLIIDNNGVFFGQDSVVDVGSIVVTTGNIAQDANLDNGVFNISNDGNTGTITLNGSVTVAEAGLAAFVSPTVQNSGVINAKLGKVAMAAGEKVTVDLYGDGLVNIEAGDALGQALIENKGVINAEAGTVIMTADAASDVVNDVINVEGVVNVSSVSQQGGKIVLSGGKKGKVNVTGALNASGATGGDIEVTGQFVSADGNAVLDASGKGDAGTIHFGGDWQGQGDTPTSEYAYVGQNAILRANSEEDGDGGEVVVWSDLGTGVYGNIEAKGGSISGNGGNVEVSSLGFYDFRGHVDTTAANGVTGMFLLDPLDILIRGGNGDGDDVDGGIATNLGHTSEGANGFISYTSNNVDPYLITEQEIEAESATNNITIQARRSITTQTGAGLDNNVTLAANRNLTIQTRNDAGDGNGVIDLSNLAFTTSGTGAITVQGSTGTGISNITLGNLTSQAGAISVSTDNGNITLGTNGTNATSSPNADGVDGKNSTLKTTTGNINLTANGTITLGGNGGNGTNSRDGGDGGKGVILTDTGIVNIIANDLKISGTAGTGPNANRVGKAGLGLINAQDSTVNIGRFSAGTIDVGDNNGSSFRIDQNEIYKIFAANLTIGNENTTNVTVDNVDLYALLSISEDTDTLPAPSQGCENSGGGNPHCGVNNTLMMNSANLTLKSTQFVDIIGEGLTMGTGWVTVDAPRLDLNGRVFAKDTVNGNSYLLGDSRLIGTEQLLLINVLSPNARIQQALDFADSTARETINVEAGTYNEAVVVNKSVDLLGNNAGTAGYAGRVAESIVTGASPAFTVNAYNVVIDGFLMSGPTLTYGVLLNDVRGTVITNNIIDGASIAGIGGSVDSEPGPSFGTLVVSNNKIDGASTSDGINIIGDPSAGNVVTGVDIDITDNQIGTDSAVGNGIVFANNLTSGIGTANIDIDSNTVVAADAGVLFSGSITGGATVNITSNSITGGDDAVSLVGAINNSNVNINNNSAIRYGADAGDRGIDIQGGIAGTSVVNINSNTIDPITGNTGDDGIGIKGGIGGTSAVTISGNLIALGAGFAGVVADDIGAAIDIDTITGNARLLISGNTMEGDEDGIRISGPVTTTSTALTGGYGVLISGNTMQGLNRHVVEFGGAITNAKIGINDNALLNVAGNPASGFGLNGIHFTGALTGAQVDILRNSAINAANHGIYFANNIGTSTVNIHDNNINADANNAGGGDGIRFDGLISNGAVINIGDGSGATVNVDASNVISGANGINFANDVYNNAQIVIDGNRIGYGGTAGSPTTGAGTQVTADGIRFGDGVYDSSNVTISDNFIRSADEGIQFASNVYGNGGKVLIDNNTVRAQTNGIEFTGDIFDERLIEISNNDVEAVNEDGIRFAGLTTNALIGVTVQDEIWIHGNEITGGDSGIHFEENVDANRHDIRISNNDITGQSVNGITFDGQIGGLESQIWILDNTSIVGQVDGIHFGQGIFDDATLEISGNNWIEGLTDDGINIIGDVNASDVLINNNDNIVSFADGIDFNGAITNGANVVITGNNDGIQADDHGILFNGNVDGGSVIDIFDNIIQANLDNGVIGSGIFFNGTIGLSTINIGDGDGLNVGSDPSNIISVGLNGFGSADDLDGIHFNKAVNTGAVINIDGNRIGYTAPAVAGPHTADEVADDGIEFRDNVTDADINITDNWIRANDDGVAFTGIVGGTSNILIGGATDKNDIHSDDDGIYFADEVTDEALIEISHNNIDVDSSGIVFDGPTNSVFNFGSHTPEILITENSIVGGNNGIAFYGLMSGAGHDIEISNNIRIIGDGNDGIRHLGGINDSELWILDNDEIWGEDDGIHIEGLFSNDALIEISGNTDIDSDNDDGIEVSQSGVGDVDVNITNNFIHSVGENGIHLNGGANVEVAYNIINNSGARGLYASGQDNGSIVLVGNEFNDNPIGAEFESGTIDLTAPFADRNIFNGGNVGLRFDPGRRGDPSKLILVNDGNPAFGGTIGETEFNGQTQFYVELLNGAFFAPGFPTILNGWHATYDGFRPDTVPFLSIAQFNAINDKIWDFRDIGSVGLFFFGALPDIDDERLFREFAAFNGDITGLNVRILGLPRLPGQIGGPLELNAISTFAGRGATTTIASAADLNNIETAAGGDSSGAQPSSQSSTAAMLNAIETAAGGEGDANTNCWGNAITTAAGGTAVNVTYSGTFEGNLEQAAACGGAF